jgi:hypothetical protein
MEDSGDESEDGDSSDKRVPASRQRGEEQLGTSKNWPYFSLDGHRLSELGLGHPSSAMPLAENILVVH